MKGDSPRWKSEDNALFIIITPHPETKKTVEEKLILNSDQGYKKKQPKNNTHHRLSG